MVKAIEKITAIPISILNVQVCIILFILFFCLRLRFLNIFNNSYVNSKYTMYYTGSNFCGTFRKTQVQYQTHLKNPLRGF